MILFSCSSATTSHRTGARCSRVAHGGARGRRDRLERDRVQCDRRDRGTGALLLGTELRHGAGGGVLRSQRD